MNKLFFALSDRLQRLLENHTDLYFKERHWIENPTRTYRGSGINGESRMITESTPEVILDLSEERNQIELEIKKVSRKLELLTAPVKMADSTEDVTITGLFGPFSS